jgi:hypothetical protein
MMGRIPSWQSAAVDVLDRLLFNQILVFRVYSDSEREWLARIVNGVTSAVGETDTTGLHAQCLTHCVLCLMEVQLSEDLDKLRLPGIVFPERPEGVSEEQSRRIQEYNRSYFQASVIAMSKMVHGDAMAPAFEIAKDLTPALRHAPASVRYRLVERCLVYAFPQAPLDGLSWLVKSDVIRSDKQMAAKLTELPTPAVFARIGLLCEFDMIRNYIGRVAGAPNVAAVALNNSAIKLSEATNKVLLRMQYGIEELTRLESLSNSVPTFDTGKLHDPDYLRDFYERVSRFCPHMRIAKGTLGKWVGALGAVMVEIDRFRHRTDKRIYVEADNRNTITSNVACALKHRGFTVGGRTLYTRHSEFSEKLFNQVRTYHQILGSAGAAIPAHFGDFFYYSIMPNTADL